MRGGGRLQRAAAALVAVSLAAAALVALAGVRGGSVGAVELLLPWYEVASDGDGLGPESVNMWKVPPTVAYVHPNTFQDPTKWNGDHVLNGGNKEWAEEDAALHAYNMENWRNKILSTQVVRQKQQYNLMNVGGPRGAAGGPAQSLRMQSPSATGPARGMVGTMSTARASDEPAKTTASARGGRRHSRRSSDGADAELVKIERGNQRLLRRILRRLRRKRAGGRGDGGRGYRRSYMRRLERRNQRNLDAISQRLADLTQETTHARHGHPGRV